jgi:putative endonuclease
VADAGGAGDGGRRARGQEAEALAASFLEQRGYRVLARNHALRLGEVDLVCERDGVLCFVEVRSRTGADHGGPEETVDRRKARRVVLAATDWLERNPAPGRDIRFDVVAVTYEDGAAAPVVVHFPAAFDADGAPSLF